MSQPLLPVPIKAIRNTISGTTYFPSLNLTVHNEDLKLAVKVVSQIVNEVSQVTRFSQGWIWGFGFVCVLLVIAIGFALYFGIRKVRSFYLSFFKTTQPDSEQPDSLIFHSPFCVLAKVTKLVGLKNGGRVSPTNLVTLLARKMVNRKSLER
jgi:hypothetical protein